MSIIDKKKKNEILLYFVNILVHYVIFKNVIFFIKKKILNFTD